MTEQKWKITEFADATVGIHAPDGKHWLEIATLRGLHARRNADTILKAVNAHDELVKALEWAMKQIPPYSKRIPRQNEAWCDGYDAAVAALSKAKAS